MKSEPTNRSKQIKELTASVKARLINIAKQTDRDFNAILLQFSRTIPLPISKTVVPAMAINILRMLFKVITISFHRKYSDSVDRPSSKSHL